jgi:polysaccharide pyruvyl transferase CsaB
MTILLAGYYGFRNWGDEASLAVLVDALRPPAEPASSERESSVELIALSGDPPFTRQTYGIEAVARTDWRRVRAAVRRAVALILGGGSLLQDATSLRSLLYYLLLIRWGLQAHGRVLLVGQGMGPFHRPLSRYLVRRTLNRVPFLSLRDEESAHLLRQIGVRAPMRVDADLTWALSPRPTPFELPAEPPCVGLAPRPWRDLPLREAFANLCVRLLEAGWQPVLIPIAESVEGQGKPRPMVIPPPTHPAQLLTLMRSLHGMISMRLHGAIFAASQGVPLLCLAYDPKVSALAQQIAVPVILLQGDWQAALNQPWSALQRNLVVPNRERICALQQRARELLETVRQQVFEV